ncbi:GH25 family lysozyme [Sphingobacterium oryzagri]|uniref:GH25 family lysozyme n=1 Tax=Sphingobacterium oryzagri TaxID=3025669 RepID=A0ABY7WED5_9SPHI|nr:GH25 family lysozyme [Sphingobacterium sp. KACC 22765]WDF67245.1 GH25 family lysozyme [Sphingobacterium sp. KACC 22765]
MAKSKRTVKKKTQSAAAENRKFLLWSILIPSILVLLGAVILWRTDLSYTLKRWMYGDDEGKMHNADEHAQRNLGLMERHDDYIYGIDISQYQGRIKWLEVNTIHDKIPLDFVFIRATMGEKKQDKRFDENWAAAQSRTKLRGAYHYFRPNENSKRQARNFIRAVSLRPGDLPPVLDIEERPRSQPMDSLKVGLKRWLDEVEAHYHVQPILYSGDSYFTDFLEKEFSNYVLWIANYNFWVDKPKKHWHFWQFSEKGFVRGIDGYVDLNLFKGDIEELETLAIPY